MSTDMEQLGEIYREGSKQLLPRAQGALDQLMRRDVQKVMVDNLEAERQGDGTPMAPHSALTKILRKEQGITSGKIGQASGGMLKSYKSQLAVKRIGEATWRVGPANKADERIANFFINDDQQFTTKKQEDFFYGASGTKAFVPENTLIRREGRDFTLTDKQELEVLDKGADIVTNVMFDSLELPAVTDFYTSRRGAGA